MDTRDGIDISFVDTGDVFLHYMVDTTLLHAYIACTHCVCFCQIQSASRICRLLVLSANVSSINVCSNKCFLKILTVLQLFRTL